jgi:hypothetical protein
MNAHPSSINSALHIAHVSARNALLAALLCLASPSPGAQELPPLPKGVAELKFSEFFVNPVGPRGLELTD